MLGRQQNLAPREVCCRNMQGVHYRNPVLHRFGSPDLKHSIEVSKAISMFEILAVKTHLQLVLMMRWMEHDLELEKRAVPKLERRLREHPKRALADGFRISAKGGVQQPAVGQ